MLGAMAMAGSDGPLVALGLTKPGDWASDVIPHLGFGAAAYATLAALDDGTTEYQRSSLVTGRAAGAR
jgi:hypothetical protein